MQSGAESRPRVVVIAGPNGAGKSTAAPFLLRDELRITAYVDADVIARGLAAYAPETTAHQAGEVMLSQLDRLQVALRSFAFESTLAGRTHMSRLEPQRAACATGCQWYKEGSHVSRRLDLQYARHHR